MGQPKPFLRWHGTTFLEGILNQVKSQGIHQILVVGNPAWTARYKTLLDPSIGLIFNPSPDSEMIESIRLGLNRLSPGTSYAWIWPVDTPVVKPETLERLKTECRPHGRKIIIPTDNEKRGHPIAIPRCLFRKVADWYGKNGLKGFIEMLDTEVRIIEVADPRIRLDIDTPEDFETFQRGAG